MMEQISVPPANAALAERIRAGDRCAEEQLVARFHKSVFTMALARTRDLETAREVVQEVMAAVLPALRTGKLQQHEKLAEFIRATTRNQISNHLRGRRPNAPDLGHLRAGQSSDPARVFERSERLSLVRRALDQLSPLDRKILLMSLLDGSKPGEIAVSLGLGAARVRQRKLRALRKVFEIVRKMSRT